LHNNTCLAAALEELAKAGIRQPQVARGGKHLQARWTTPRDLRRILREDGMLEAPEPRAPLPRTPRRLDLLERRLVEVERVRLHRKAARRLYCL
jgi:hypothetical protein